MDWVALLSTLGIAAAVAFVLYILVRKNVPVLNGVLTDMSAVVGFFIKTMVKDPVLKSKLLRWVDKIPIIWSKIEVSKTRIKAEIEVAGGDPNNILEYQAALTEESITIAKEIAKEFGLQADETILYWITEALGYLSLFFRKPNSGNVPANSETVVIDLQKLQDQGSTDTGN